jgi:hypothetical protein
VLTTKRAPEATAWRANPSGVARMALATASGSRSACEVIQF